MHGSGGAHTSFIREDAAGSTTCHSQRHGGTNETANGGSRRKSVLKNYAKGGRNRTDVSNDNRQAGNNINQNHGHYKFAAEIADLLNATGQNHDGAEYRDDNAGNDQGHTEHIIDTSGQRVGLHEAGVSQNFDKQGNGIETG